MDIIELLRRLKDNNIDVSLAGDNLEIGYDGEELPVALYNEIKSNKPAIIKFLEQLNVDENDVIEVQQEKERVPLSFAQERLWFIDQMEGSVQYHLNTVLRLRGALNSAAMEYAFRSIINRHEVLRTVFAQQDEEVYQRVLDKNEFQLPVVENIVNSNDEGSLHQYIASLVNKPFDLGLDHMVRAYLIKLEKDHYILLVIIHHIVSDGWSLPILIQELQELYNAFLFTFPLVVKGSAANSTQTEGTI